MMDTVLRPLCGVNEEAAREVQRLSVDGDSVTAQRAQEILRWPDIIWPDL